MSISYFLAAVPIAASAAAVDIDVVVGLPVATVVAGTAIAVPVDSVVVGKVTAAKKLSDDDR